MSARPDIGIGDYDREAFSADAYSDEPRARGNGAGVANAADAIILRPIHEIVAERREPAWLLHRILEARVLAVIAGPRGTFKSFIALDWAMRMAAEGHTGVILSGEGAGLDRRVAAWMQQHGDGIDLQSLPLMALERPLSLNIAVELGKLKAAMTALESDPAFIVIDTLSKFSAGLDENDNGQVAAFLSALASELRDTFLCTVLLVAHSGHSDAERPRGASALMSNPDAEYIVKRPNHGMAVSVSRERFKDTASLPPLGYEARVIDLGRTDRYGDPVTSLALVSTDPPVSAKAKAGLGKNQERGLAALSEWVRANAGSTHLSSIDLASLLKAQGIKDRKRRAEVTDFLVNIRMLSPAVGGHTVHPEAL